MIVEVKPHGVSTIHELSLRYDIPEITLGKILDKRRSYNELYDKDLHRYFNDKEAYEAIKKYRSERICVKFPLFSKGDTTNTQE